MTLIAPHKNPLTACAALVIATSIAGCSSGLDLPELPSEKLTNQLILPAVSSEDSRACDGETLGTVVEHSDGTTDICVGELGVFADAELRMGSIPNQTPRERYAGLAIYQDSMNPRTGRHTGQPHYFLVGLQIFDDGIGYGCSSSYSGGSSTGHASNAARDVLWQQGLCTMGEGAAFLGVEGDVTIVRLELPDGNQAVLELTRVD